MKKLKTTVKTLSDLHESGLVTNCELPQLQEVVNQFNVAITPAILSLIDSTDSNDPIAAQFVPNIRELNQLPQDMADPIGDHVHEKVKGLVHRYPDRCLLKVVNVCPVYCRFCFRKEMIGPGSQVMAGKDLENAYHYIANHPEIWEVILSGGDPLMLKPAQLARIIESIAAIDHVEVIRIHTRIPVVDPQRITPELLAALKIPKALYIVLHANHPKEFSSDMINACSAIIDHGIPMLSQTVLLKGVNNDRETLKELMKAFVRHRIKPYYLHHLDMAKGSDHFRTSLSEGQVLVKSLQGSVSGLCQPTYVLDIPGGAGKIPVGPCYAKQQEQAWQIEDYQGGLHLYESS